MAESRAAIRYAKAVLSLATENKVAEAVASDMKSISSSISGSDELSLMLQSPVIRSADKKAVLTSVFHKTEEATKSLIETLLANKRIALLGEVAKKYIQLYDAMRDTQVAKVTTAVPLTDTLKTKVLEKVKELTGRTSELENVIDSSIIGGFILRVGDLEYNASVANKLNNLKREFSLN
jgi:F-type H+-transporting ATPase subunit delta